MNQEEIIPFYHEAMRYCIEHGYKDEIEWCRDRPPFKQTDENTFFNEYVWVVLNAGMREQVARKIYDRFMEKLDTNIIGHKGKRKAVEEAFGKYEVWFRELESIEGDTKRVEHLESLPWIGRITKYHLARNIGIDVAKPDRHLVRLCARFGFKDVQEMCTYISKAT